MNLITPETRATDVARRCPTARHIFDQHGTSLCGETSPELKFAGDR